MGNSSNKGFSTRAIHAGGHPDKETGAVMPPIYQTSTYVQSSPGEHKGYEYTRSHNPTRSRLEENLASLEQTTYALTSASGLSMIDLIMHMLPLGSKIISGDDVYGGTYRLFTTVFQDRHDFTFIDTTDLNAVKKALQEGADLIWLESPTNPTLKISDIVSIASIAKDTNTLSVVDNTFMSPYFQNPVVLGADIAYHSLTKFINGHSDVVGGAVMTDNETIYHKLFTLQNSIGPCASPFDSWLVLRGIKTLGVRMQRHAENAQQVAEFLEKHPRVQKVVYPGLKSHPQHELAATQMSGFGGMITFYLDGDIEAARTVLERVKLFALAESLGGVESLIEHPAIMTHASVPKAVRESIGLYDNLIRLSVGIEDVEDLIDDLSSAMQ
ncbi:MAG TPA: cystathionine gamma-synthase [Bacteroidetes bacterium]|nr:cystathionine gamma-synthase [Bacteroidota bacterium]|tara:strand:+ start:475 stop:1626 length:1152 start_codon:yes stop_codon:yes gene_type:complete